MTYRNFPTHYMPVPCLRAHTHSTRADCSLQLAVTAWRATLCIVGLGPGACINVHASEKGLGGSSCMA